MDKMKLLQVIDGYRRTYDLNKSLSRVLNGEVSFVAMFHNVLYDRTPEDNYTVTFKEFCGGVPNSV